MRAAGTAGRTGPVLIGIVALSVVVASQMSCTSIAPAVGSACSPGEALYRRRCGRCHDLFPPHAYSDAKWRSAVGRNQLAAGLTDAEAEAALAWLQSAN